MNILLITDDFFPKTGGVAEYDKSIASALSLSGHRVFVLTRNNECKDDFIFKVVRYPYSRYLSSLVPTIYALWLVFTQNINIVILGYFMSTIALGGRLSKLFTKSKLCVVVCGFDLIYSRRTFVDRFVANNIMRAADIVLTDSDYTAGKVVGEFRNNSKVYTLYPVIKEEYLAVKQKYPIEKENAVILSVCSLVSGKGLDIVIRAFAGVCNELPTVSLIIVGDGPLKDELKHMANELGVGNKVIFMGRIPQNQLINLYESCDLFVMPSVTDERGRFEGFGIVYLEAALFSKPVIATKSGGIPEAVVDGVTGILVEPGNINQLKSAIIELLGNNELRARLGQQGYKRVVNEFKLDNMKVKLDKYLAILQL